MQSNTYERICVLQGSNFVEVTLSFSLRSTLEIHLFAVLLFASYFRTGLPRKGFKFHHLGNEKISREGH